MSEQIYESAFDTCHHTLWLWCMRVQLQPGDDSPCCSHGPPADCSLSPCLPPNHTHTCWPGKPPAAAPLARSKSLQSPAAHSTCPVLCECVQSSTQHNAAIRNQHSRPPPLSSNYALTCDSPAACEANIGLLLWLRQPSHSHGCQPPRLRPLHTVPCQHTHPSPKHTHTHTHTLPCLTPGGQPQCWRTWCGTAP